MKVYVITKGCYSDYHICGVCLDKKKAKEIAEAVSEEPRSLYEARVEEYDTDQFETQKLRFVVEYYSHKWTAEYDDYDFWKEYSENTVKDSHNFIVYADSPEQAIKIAQDMRAEYLAKKKGIID